MFTRRHLAAALGLLAVVAFAGPAAAQYTGQRVPLGILVTNWDCVPCAPANQALDAFMPTQGNDVALIRVHCWWPGPADPIYLANIPQSTYLVDNTPAGADYAPHLWLDNLVNLGSEGGGFAAGFNARKQVPAPLEITVGYDIAASQVHATVHVLDAMPAGDYRLYVAVTEDNVYAAGVNGEDRHNQAFRRLYPDLAGIPVANAVGDQTFVVDTPLHIRWVFDKCRATVFVQEYASAVVMNAGTMFLHEAASTPVGGADLPATRLLGAAPNPFNPQTTIRFALASAGPAEVAIHDLAGRRVRVLTSGTLAAGGHEVVWHGDDGQGQPVPSGVYLVRLRAAGTVDTDRVVLTK
jgi:hypothetical protein